jgi:hypothetical protein
MLTTTPKRNPASKSNMSDAALGPSEGHARAGRELQRRHPAAGGQSKRKASKVHMTQNPEQPGGRIFEGHLHDGIGIDDDPPLSPDERPRRVVQLCCSFLRNLAFHRAGRDIEVQNKLLDPRHPQAAFWREAHGNFFDVCVLDWGKLFADGKKGD